MLLTGIATYVLATGTRAREDSRFENAVQAAEDRIVARLQTYLALLRGGAALFVGSDTVQPHEFRAFVQRLRIPEYYPGVQGIGFSHYVRPGEEQSYARAMRRIYPDFRLWPDTPRVERHAIAFLEPLDRRNAEAIGYNMFADPVRREAMMRARDQGITALSGKVILVQEIDAEKQAGFLIYTPVFDTAAIPPTVQERRARLRGFVYGPFRAGDFFTGLFGSERFPRVRFRVFDGEPEPDNLVYDSDPGGRIEHAHLHQLVELPLAGRSWTIEFRPTRYFVSAVPATFAPGVALLGIVLSIVLFMATRAQAIAQAKAEHSQRTRSRFLATMSHELRTPLNAIIGYNDLLLAGIYGPLTPQQLTGIERSQKAAQHLLELVNDVLDLSKIEADKIEIALEEVRVPQLIDDLLITIRPMVERAGSRLEIDCTQPVTPVVSDPRRIRQILLNLLSNAAKFGEGRPITVHCRATPEGGAVVSVTDRGVGIPREEVARAFEEFVQLDAASRTKPGTGLGLAISRRLADRLGAKLEVESSVGVGSTFRLVLPHHPAGTPTAVPRFRS